MRRRLIIIHLFLIFCLLAPTAWAVNFAIVDGATNTSTGNTDYTSAGFGTPTCAMVFASYGTADGTAVDHGLVAIGATDGTNQVSLAGASEDGVNPSDTGSYQNASSTLSIVTPTVQSSLDGQATGSLITDGLRLNTTDAFSAAYKLKVLLIGGSGVAGCQVGSVALQTTVDTASPVSVPFTADVILVWSVSDSGSAPLTNMLTMGAYVNDGSDTQAALSLKDNGSASPTTPHMKLDTGRVSRRVISGNNGLAGQIQNVDGTGFDIYSRDSGTSTVTVQYLALDLDSSLGAYLTTDASPTATGSESITGVGFTPQFGLGIYSSVLANDTLYTDGSAESFGIGLFTAAASACVGLATDNNVATANTESLTDNAALCLRKDGALFQEASLTSFDSDGVTFNHTTADGTARQRVFLFIEEGAAASLGPLRRRF